MNKTLYSLELLQYNKILILLSFGKDMEFLFIDGGSVTCYIPFGKLIGDIREAKYTYAL